MCVGPNAGTAASIFEKMDEIFQSDEIPWSNCTAASVDNTSVNIVKHNSILTRVKSKNAAVYFMGCPCHIVHNICVKAAGKFLQVSCLPHSPAVLA